MKLSEELRILHESGDAGRMVEGCAEQAEELERQRDELLEFSERAKTLLRATVDIINKCDEGPFVVSPMEVDVFYDDADCDGGCLRGDIAWLLEIDDNVKPLRRGKDTP